jgi:hypothetical protein
MTRLLQQTIPRQLINSSSWYFQVVNILESLEFTLPFIRPKPRNLMHLRALMDMATWIMVLKRSIEIPGMQISDRRGFLNFSSNTLLNLIRNTPQTTIIPSVKTWLRDAFANCQTPQSIPNCVTDDVYLQLVDIFIHYLKAWAKHDVNKNKEETLNFIKILSGTSQRIVYFSCKETNCAICMSGLDEEDEKSAVHLKITQLPCGHCFHTSCISDWIQENQSCPTCRTKIISPISALPSRFPRQPFPKASPLRRASFDGFVKRIEPGKRKLDMYPKASLPRRKSL